VKKGCIAYTFFGSQPKYVDGIRHTAQLLYSGTSSLFSAQVSYELLIFTDSISCEFLKSVLSPYPFVKIFLVNKRCHFFSVKRLWRYCILHRKHLMNYDFCLFRDSDSLFAPSEQELVDLWLESDYRYLIIRGTSIHTWPVLAGLFGVKSSDYHNLKCLMAKPPRLFYSCPDFYVKDQLLLALFIYPFISKHSLVFTAFWRYRGESAIPLRVLSSGFPGSHFSLSEDPSLYGVSLLYESTQDHPPLCLAPPILFALFFKFSVRFFTVWKPISLLLQRFMICI